MLNHSIADFAFYRLASTFLCLGSIFPSPNSKPRKSTVALPNWHLFLLRVMPAFWIAVKTLSMSIMCADHDLLWTKTSPRYPAEQALDLALPCQLFYWMYYMLLITLEDILVNNVLLELQILYISWILHQGAHSNKPLLYLVWSDMQVGLFWR